MLEYELSEEGNCSLWHWHEAQYREHSTWLKNILLRVINGASFYRWGKWTQTQRIVFPGCIDVQGQSYDGTSSPGHCSGTTGLCSSIEWELCWQKAGELGWREDGGRHMKSGPAAAQRATRFRLDLVVDCLPRTFYHPQTPLFTVPTQPKTSTVSQCWISFTPRLLSFVVENHVIGQDAIITNLRIPVLDEIPGKQ